jgi:hypothetical protein
MAVTRFIQSGINTGTRYRNFKTNVVGLLNYFGDGLDGSINTISNTLIQVQNKNGSYDGDMAVLNLESLTINSGHTLTTDQPCRGLMIYVNGNCTINGTLSMKGKGAFANPTISGASDNNVVDSSGLRFPFRTSSGSATTNPSESLLNGCGNKARTYIANHFPLLGNGTVLTVQRTGAAGGGANASGNNGSTGQSGGGGGGQTLQGNAPQGVGGNGAAGTCFSGGSGGGGGGWDNGAGGNGALYGGQGGFGNGAGGCNFHTGGGSGNPRGNGTCTHEPAEEGTGGLIVLIVRGVLTVGSGGLITAQGSRGGYPTATNLGNSRGGGSGGGNIILAYANGYTNNGTVSVSGTTASSSILGGTGSIQTLAILE